MPSKMTKKKLICTDPLRPVRITVCVMLAAALSMFFLPFVTLSVTEDNLLLQIFANILPKPRSLSGVELIFAFTAGQTINPHVNIGPLPCNFYILAAVLFTVTAFAVLLIPKLRALRYLISSVFSLFSGAAVILFRIRFKAYYTAYTKNGGELLGTWFEESKLIVTGRAPYVICAVLLLLCCMACLLLYSQAKYDPYFTRSSDEES